MYNINLWWEGKCRWLQRKNGKWTMNSIMHLLQPIHLKYVNKTWTKNIDFPLKYKKFRCAAHTILMKSFSKSFNEKWKSRLHIYWQKSRHRSSHKIWLCTPQNLVMQCLNGKCPGSVKFQWTGDVNYLRKETEYRCIQTSKHSIVVCWCKLCLLPSSRIN